MRDALGDRGRKLRLALTTMLTLAIGLVAIASAQASSTVAVTPTSPTIGIQSAPFGESDVWAAYMVWAYKNVPAFNLKTGDTVGFDLTEQNDVDIQLQIAMAPTTTNGGDVNSGPFTQIVPNTQIPANPRGNSTSGDYELTFTAQAPFNFPGGGLLIRFGNPAGAFATDSNATGVGGSDNVALPTDPSGYFVGRDVRDADGGAPWTGDFYADGVGGFLLNIADIAPTPPSSAPTAAPTKKKCKKKHKKRSAAASKKCKKKRP
jgi:hypothetical protein